MSQAPKSEYRVVWMHRLRGVSRPSWMDKVCATKAEAEAIASTLAESKSCSGVMVQSREVTSWSALGRAA